MAVDQKFSIGRDDVLEKERHTKTLGTLGTRKLQQKKSDVSCGLPEVRNRLEFGFNITHTLLSVKPWLR